MRRIATGIALLFISAQGAWADTVVDLGKRRQGDVEIACIEAGAAVWGSGPGGATYGCTKSNCDGKGGQCTVVCQKATNECSGSTPGRITGPPGQYDLLKILKYSPARIPERGLLEGAPDGSPSGPSGPGAPKPSSPPGGKLY